MPIGNISQSLRTCDTGVISFLPTKQSASNFRRLCLSTSWYQLYLVVIVLAGRSDRGLEDVFWFKIIPAVTTEPEALPPSAE